MSLRSKATSDAARLTQALSAALRRQGITSEPYDADFIVGVLMDTLGKMDAVLTSGGVRRFRR